MLDWITGGVLATIASFFRLLDGFWRRVVPRKVVVAVSAIFFLCAIGFVVWMQQAPSPKPVDAPQREFSALRALKHVHKIAHKKHPMWSQENKKVRSYLLREMRTLGLKPQTQTRPLPREGLHPRASRLAGLPVVNLMARIKGSRSTGAVLLVAHYDSAHRGPGAADDAAAVAAILETVRALKHHPRLRNDLILLITDAEEIGLWGAKLFAKHHPWMKDAKLVLNFEARGVAGPSLMFETNKNNGFVIQQFSRGDHAPRGSSLFFEVYRRLPNDTDFSVFKRAGVQGLNFAFIEKVRHYHQKTDDVKHLSRASLQDHGEHMLSLVNALGHADLSKVQQSPNSVYFDVLGLGLVQYSESTGIVLAVLALLLCCFLLVVAVRKGEARWHGVGLAFLQLLIIAAMAGAAVGALAWYTLQWKGRRLYGFYYDILNDGWYVVAFLCLTACIYFVVHALTSRWLQRMECALAALLWWSGVSIFLAWKVAGAGYLSLWPLMGGLFTVSYILYSEEIEDKAPFLASLAWLGELPLLLLAAPLFYHVPYALTLTMTGATSLLFVLFFSLAFATQDALTWAGKWRPALGTFVAFVITYTLPLVL